MISMGGALPFRHWYWLTPTDWRQKEKERRERVRNKREVSPLLFLLVSLLFWVIDSEWVPDTETKTKTPRYLHQQQWAMEERPETELISIPATPRVSTPEILTPSGQRSPRPASKAWTPTSFISPRFLSPIGTPMKRVLINMKGYLEEVGHLTKLNPQDAWLPITESRNGNAHYAAFHNLNAGVGFQALVLPVAFAFLGWYDFYHCSILYFFLASLRSLLFDFSSYSVNFLGA